MVRRISIILLSIGAVGSLAGCPKSSTGDRGKGGRMAERTIERVREEHTDEWMAIPGVVGTAIGMSEGKPCVMIFTSSRTDHIRAQIPPEVEGYPVIVQETGAFRALDRQ
jgi:hypothetical protein